MSILILGIGNVLMGDEGVGVHAVRWLESLPLPEGVETLDGGTGGFHLLGHLMDHPCVIMIDATMDGHAPGTVRLIKPKFASDFPKSLSAHDIGLKDLVESAAVLDGLPDIYLITVSIAEIQPGMNMDLSPEVRDALPHIRAIISHILKTAEFSNPSIEAMMN